MATVGGAYTVTRGKWYELGMASGEIDGRSQLLDSLCGLAPGDLDTDADVRFDVKATSVTLSRHGNGIEIRCSR